MTIWIMVSSKKSVGPKKIVIRRQEAEPHDRIEIRSIDCFSEDFEAVEPKNSDSE